ncbi:MAG: hypothetical protein V4693_11995 [Pseudomonadota bacterium]
MLLAHTEPASRARVITDAHEVASRLLELQASLNEDLLLEANLRGFDARLEATPAHAPTAAGTYHWHAFVFAMRIALKERGWAIKNHMNCPFVISPDKTVSILVMTGDSETGKEFGIPKNQADKGRVLSDAIDINQSYDLFESAAISHMERGASGTQLWVLLYHVERDSTGMPKEIRTELSLPSRFEKKKIVGWTERIVLRSLDVGAEPAIERPAPVEPIDFPVERRNAG